MRTALVCLALVACSKEKGPPPPSALENLISDQAIGVTRELAEGFAILGAVRDLIDKNQPCWPLLTAQLKAGYQVSLPSGSYWIAEGKLPREDVEKCVPVTFTTGAKIKDDGDLVVFETAAGKVYAAWRGGFVVFGERADVQAAIAPSAETTARWAKLLPPLTGAVSYVLRVDNTIAPLIGDGVTTWAFTFDKVTKEPPFFAGRFVATYASPEAATTGAARVKEWSSRGKFPLALEAPQDAIDLYDRLAAAVGTMKQTVTGHQLVIAFDSDQLGGPAALTAVFQGMEAVAAKLPKPAGR
jgi:hypothetical protein